MTMAGISTFLAEISIKPGENWSDIIFDSLRKSEWVFFLATKNSIESPAVQQELGASLIQGKSLIPLLVGVSPEQLPGWVDRRQAIDINSAPEKLHGIIANISEKIKVDQFWSGVIVGAITVGLIFLIANAKNT